MQLSHSFVVPVDVEQAWTVLRDIEQVAPCMPGATVEEVHGDEFSGRMKVKVGPMQITYTGRAMFVETDHDQHRTVIEARGKEARGSGTASATVTADLHGSEGQTEVSVLTDLAVTGRPAQFGRGVMLDVGEKLLNQFAGCLAEQLAGGVTSSTGNGEEPADAGAPSMSAEPPEVAPAFARMPTEDERASEDAIDLLGVAGLPVLRRAAPLAGVLAGLWLLVRVLRRRRA